jgi:hypothetical protein
MSKAAVDALVRFGAGQVSKRSTPVRVYGLAPCIFDSEMVDKILDCMKGET